MVMSMETIDIFYNFEQSEEISGKSDEIIEKIEELESLAKRFESVVQEEAANNKGLLIEEISESIGEHVEYSQLYYDAVKSSVKNSNDTYNKLINKIKAHNITVHYKVLEMNQS